MTRLRTPAQEERNISAKTAWNEYQAERTVLAQRTAKLKALRLAAEAAKPAKKS